MARVSLPIDPRIQMHPPLCTHRPRSQIGHAVARHVAESLTRSQLLQLVGLAAMRECSRVLLVSQDSLSIAWNPHVPVTLSVK